MASNDMTPREIMVQATGSIEGYARIMRQYNDMTHKTPAQVRHHLHCIHLLLQEVERLQAAAYDVYGEKPSES